MRRCARGHGMRVVHVQQGDTEVGSENLLVVRRREADGDRRRDAHRSALRALEGLQELQSFSLDIHI